MSCHAHLQVVSTQPGPWVTMADTKPEDYLALSLSTYLCCSGLFGIIALIMSLQVRWSSCMKVRVWTVHHAVLQQYRAWLGQHNLSVYEMWELAV